MPEALARSSHPTPTGAGCPSFPIAIPSPARSIERPPRPHLRILTDPIGLSSTQTRRPLPRHSAFVQSAPLAAYRLTHTNAVHIHTRDWANNYETETSPPEPVFVAVPRSEVSSKGVFGPLSRASTRGHRRRLSDRLKNFFAGLHPKRVGGGLVQHLTEAPMKGEDAARKMPAYPAQPARPHRSPGTASFLVTRHPDTRAAVDTQAITTECGPGTANVPCSVRSPHSFRPATTATPRSADTKPINLDVPILEISHFSGPTTLDSASGKGSTVSGKSGGNFVMVAMDPPMPSERGGLGHGAAGMAGIKRTRSLPSILGGW